MRYIYGPVQSRRLGLSLGVSLTPHKVCDFDCLYCQLGRTTKLSGARDEYVKIADILEELKSWFLNNPEEAKALSYVTLAGSGEPTLNLRIGELISEIKKLAPVKVAVITNASLLNDFSVRNALLAADLIVPSLDAVVPEVFLALNRPSPDIKLEDIIAGLIALRREYRGQIWLEVMLVKGVNDDIRYIKRLKEAVERINPDKIQLNSPVRSTSENDVLPVNKAKLGKIKELLGDKAEIV